MGLPLWGLKIVMAIGRQLSLLSFLFWLFPLLLFSSYQKMSSFFQKKVAKTTPNDFMQIVPATSGTVHSHIHPLPVNRSVFLQGDPGRGCWGGSPVTGREAGTHPEFRCQPQGRKTCLGVVLNQLITYINAENRAHFFTRPE